MLNDLTYVVACGDEGVRMSGAVRIGVVGAGVQVPHADKLFAALKKVFVEANFGIFSNQENDWVKQKFELPDYESANATMQQQVAALADKSGLKYLGDIAFVDPVEFRKGMKAHMVRPHNIHVAKQICLTIGGGEQKFNLGSFVVSADWVGAMVGKVGAEKAAANKEIVKEILQTQVDFYSTLRKKELPIVVEEDGPLSDEVKQKNKDVLIELGFVKV